MRSVAALAVLVVACGSSVDTVAPSFLVDASAPVAAVPAYTCKKHTCTFNASNSSDDVGIVSYTWRWPGWDAVQECEPYTWNYETTTGPTVTHTFPGPSSFVIQLVVADAVGNASSVEFLARVKGGFFWWNRCTP